MPGVHLPRLGAKLIILCPILLRTHTMKECCTLHKISTVEIHTFVYVVINVEVVDREPRSADDIVKPGRAYVCLESFLDVD
jgi:hypothetical protein